MDEELVERMPAARSTRRSISVGAGRAPRRERDWDRVAVLAIVVGAGLRVLWTLVVHRPQDYLYSDMLGYVLRAQQLAAGAPLGPGEAFFPPGTHFLLSIPFALLGNGAGLWAAAVVWCSLSIATVYLAWRLSRELLTPAAAALTAVLCAGWPLFISYGGYFTSETPALAFMIAAMWAGVVATRRDGGVALTLALLAGALGGAATAVRPQLLINVVLLASMMFLLARRRLAPVACLALGVAAVLSVVVVHNSIATGRPAGLATNGGLNFWFGHCDAKQVVTVDQENRVTAAFGHPVPGEAGRGGSYAFRSRDVWDEDFFLGLGWECIRQDGFGHVLRLGRNVLDMTATTTPWPQSAGWSLDVARSANVVYSVLLPWILVESSGLRRRRRQEGGRGAETFLLLNLACAAVVAIVVIGDPRLRTVYDVFGFALLSALLADRFQLDQPSTSTSAAPTTDDVQTLRQPGDTAS